MLLRFLSGLGCLSSPKEACEIYNQSFTAKIDSTELIVSQIQYSLLNSTFAHNQQTQSGKCTSCTLIEQAYIFRRYCLYSFLLLFLLLTLISITSLYFCKLLLLFLPYFEMLHSFLRCFTNKAKHIFDSRDVREGFGFHLSCFDS